MFYKPTLICNLLRFPAASPGDFQIAAPPWKCAIVSLKKVSTLHITDTVVCFAVHLRGLIPNYNLIPEEKTEAELRFCSWQSRGYIHFSIWQL